MARRVPPVLPYGFISFYFYCFTQALGHPSRSPKPEVCWGGNHSHRRTSVFVQGLNSAAIDLEASALDIGLSKYLEDCLLYGARGCQQMSPGETLNQRLSRPIPVSP